MIDPELVAILVCPETKQTVRQASEDTVLRVNAAIAEGRVANRGGEPVSEPLDGGLEREDGAVLYPIREDIPIMLIEEAIGLEGI